MSFPPPPPEFCVRHPQTVTGRHCTRCGRPACNSCLTQVDVGSHCADCVRSSRLAPQERLKYWNAAQHQLVTRTLVAINVVLYFWVRLGANSTLPGGFINSREYDMALSLMPIQNGDWYRLISSGFLHFSFLHIGMNMFLLWQLGLMLEPALGRARFTLLYFASMLGGAAGALALSPNALTGGASGAVFGLMAATTVGLQQRGVNPIQSGVGITLLINLLITFTIPGISIGGHLGGAIMGAAVGYAMLEPRWSRRSPLITWAAPVISMLVSLTYVAMLL
jgi:membrane associated rhomboid family serine protease